MKAGNKSKGPLWPHREKSDTVYFVKTLDEVSPNQLAEAFNTHIGTLEGEITFNKVTDLSKDIRIKALD